MDPAKQSAGGAGLCPSAALHSLMPPRRKGGGSRGNPWFPREGLGRPLEALFESSPLDDAVAIAEALPHASLAMLYPESRDLGFELLQLSREHDVMAVRKCVVQLGTPLSGALDLELDVFDCSHA